MDFRIPIIMAHEHEHTPAPIAVGTADEALAAQAALDDRAFEMLVERYETKLRRYIVRFINCSAEDAEDIVQDVFVNAYRNLNGFDTRLKFSSWIYRIAHNEAVSHMRRVTARPTAALGDDAWDALASEINTERDAERKMDGAALREAVAALDPKYRDAIVLRYFEDKSYDEISDILRKPTGSISSLIARAKRLLFQKMEQKVGQEAGHKRRIP